MARHNKTLNFYAIRLSLETINQLLTKITSCRPTIRGNAYYRKRLKCLKIGIHSILKAGKTSVKAVLVEYINLKFKDIMKYDGPDKETKRNQRTPGRPEGIEDTPSQRLLGWPTYSKWGDGETFPKMDKWGNVSQAILPDSNLFTKIQLYGSKSHFPLPEKGWECDWLHRPEGKSKSSLIMIKRGDHLRNILLDDNLPTKIQPHDFQSHFSLPMEGLEIVWLIKLQHLSHGSD